MHPKIINTNCLIISKVVDFVKVQLVNAKEALEKSDLLDFKGEYSTKTGEGVSVFFSKNNFELPSDKIGKHTLYGNIAVKEKGVEKWKPWKYEYTVGK